ncbi:ATP-dependent Lon protease pim1 [Nowakowskiella sp. JEL0078]|nr:ATP-dependent Lon protease pim1 [Nowakowskiella sp. JEL0078]
MKENRRDDNSSSLATLRISTLSPPLELALKNTIENKLDKVKTHVPTFTSNITMAHLSATTSLSDCSVLSGEENLQQESTINTSDHGVLPNFKFISLTSSASLSAVDDAFKTETQNLDWKSLPFSTQPVVPFKYGSIESNSESSSNSNEKDEILSPLETCSQSLLKFQPDKCRQNVISDPEIEGSLFSQENKLTFTDDNITEAQLSANKASTQVQKGLRALGSIFKKLMTDHHQNNTLVALPTNVETSQKSVFGRFLPKEKISKVTEQKSNNPVSEIVTEIKEQVVSISEIDKDVEIEADSEVERLMQKHFEKKYKVLKQVGSGGHSTVRLALRQSDSTLVVCKFIKQSSVWHWHYDRYSERKIPMEIYLMKMLSEKYHTSIEKDVGKGIVKYLEHFEFPGRFIIVMEYLGEDWVDFFDYIEMFGPVDEKDARDIFLQAVDTVLFLRANGYCHNDVKDENILINTNTREIKLIDFGSATSYHPGQTCSYFYGTKKFAAPETVQGDAYYPESQEVWALGALLYVTLFKMDPFKTDIEIVELDISRRINRLKNLGKENGGADISDEAVHALESMLAKDWRNRVALDHIKLLPFFTKHDSRNF